MAPAVLEAVLLWVRHSVLRGTALETVRCPLSKKPENVVGQQQHSPQVLMHGAQPNAMSGVIKAAVTIQSAEKKVIGTETNVLGLTT